jgi:outer membrane protein assembly factor BamB
MKTRHTFVLILTLFIAAATLSACTGGRRVVASGWAGIATNGDSAYLAYNNHVYAIDLTNGNERWRFPAEPDAEVTFYAPPAITDDGQIIVGGYNNVLYSLNPDNGQLNWSYEQSEGRYIGGPLVTEYGIYAPSTDNNVHALDKNGEEIWAQPFTTEQEIWARPAAAKDCECIYITSMDHRVYAVDASTGKEIWKTKDLGGAIVGVPAVGEDGVLYIGTFAKEMIALQAQDGSEIWRFPTQDWVWAGPTLSDDKVFFGDLSGTFYALDRASGEQAWQIQPGSSIVGTPLLTEEAIYFTTEEGALISVTPDGTSRWQQPLEGNTYTGPIAAGDLILVATSQDEALLVAMDSNGVQKWAFGEAAE